MIPLRDNIRPQVFPFVTYALIAANLAVFAYEFALGSALEPFFQRYGIVPAVWSRPEPWLSGRLLPLLTSMFLHGGFMHALSNVWVLYIFGDNVEDRLGHSRFLLFYVLTGLAAGLFHLVTNPGSPVPTIGASGAIAGVMGGYFLLFPHARVSTLVPVFLYAEVIEVPAVVFLGLWLLTQLYSGVMSLGARFGGIAWWAHVGGFAAGLLLVGRFLPRQRRRVFYTVR